MTGTEVKSEVFVKNGSLFSTVNDQTTPLLPESETRFYIPQTDVYLDFIIDSSGKILKAIIPTQNQTWEKLN